MVRGLLLTIELETKKPTAIYWTLVVTSSYAVLEFDAATINFLHVFCKLSLWQGTAVCIATLGPIQLSSGYSTNRLLLVFQIVQRRLRQQRTLQHLHSTIFTVR